MISSFYFIFLGTFGWGISLFLIKVLLVSLTPTEIVLYRMMIGFVTLLFIILILRIRPHNYKQLCLDGLVLGVFNITIPYYFTTIAEKQVSSSLAAILNALTPIFTYLLGIFFFSGKKKFSYITILSVFSGFVGVMIIQWSMFQSEISGSGLLILILASLSYAIAANYMHLRSENNPILVSSIASLVAIICLLAFKMLGKESIQWNWPQSNSGLLSLLWLGVISSGLSLYLYCVLINRIGATSASMITYLMTASGIITGVLFLQEQFSIASIIGCSFIFLALLSINK